MKNLIYLLLGRISLACAAAMLMPYIYTVNYENAMYAPAYSYSILAVLAITVALFAHGEKHGEKLSITAGAVFMFLSWMLLSVIGTLPYIFTESLSWYNALMECISGFTTTGLTSLHSHAPKSVILWRSITQWLGGMNILLMLTAVVPAVTKGFGIYYAMPVNLRNAIMTLPHISIITRRVTLVYLFMTVLATELFVLSGLSLFDSINYVMVTISTGGCYWTSAGVELNIWVFIVLMFGLVASGCNVLVYLQSGRWAQVKRNIRYTIHSAELRMFILLLLVCSIMVAMNLYETGQFSIWGAFGRALFYVSSYASTTGIMVEQLDCWSEADELILLLVSIIGGCLGSMAGGFKMLRVIILLKSSWLELKRTLHPNMVLNLTVDNGTVPLDVISRILSFFFMYVVIIVFSMMIISLSGYDIEPALHITIGCLTSTGQLALFHMQPIDMYNMPALIKIYCCFLMVLGKVEIMSFLILMQGCIQKLQKKRW